MNGDRSERAFTRIEAALARVEAAARRPRVGGNVADADTLRAKHEQLRSAVTQSLDQLDRLIGGDQP